MEAKGESGRWSSRRALSTPIAAVVMIVVIVVVGAGGYFGLKGAQPAASSKTSCVPATSPACAVLSNTHDVSLFAPFPSSQTGTPIPFVATLPTGENAQKYNFTFGDGASSGWVANNQVSHAYKGPGTYIVSVQALVNNVPHDNYKGGLAVLSISTSYANGNAANAPAVSGRITNNGSTTPNPTAIIGTGGTVSVAGSYTGAPTNPIYAVQSPTVVGSSGLTVTATNTTSSATGKATFSNSGTFWLVFVGKSVTSAGVVAYQNYTWTVFVAATGLSAGSTAPPAAASKHKGSLIVYELAPGGASSEDPAIAYDTVSFEPILNVYQTLITYNGSSTGPTYQSYVPEIATCVPGSPACAAMYGGNTLIDSSGNNYTFVISKTPQFYDPATGNSWGVWPTDVLFSVARTMAFSTLPCYQCNNGWILSQSLLPLGNPGWDGAAHYLDNNTPGNIFNSVTINGSSCPTQVATAGDHGCVTFHASGLGQIWPYFLELISDGLGGSIVPCGWYSAPAQGAGLPYWTQGNVSGSGDHPCATPGTSGWGVNPSTLSPTAWDAYEVQGSGLLGTFIGNVQWTMAGSGPYYLPVNGLTVAQSYTLKANPAYASNPACTWSGCQPMKGHFASNVSVVWEGTETPGEQSYQAGIADFAGIPATQAGYLLQLVQQGKIGVTSFPSISIYFNPFNLAYNTATVGTWATSPVNIPSTWFSYVAMRQFFVNAFPYQTSQTSISTKDGVQYNFNYGGAIPQFMANYYPTNISWPSSDPDTNPSHVGGAAWWWAQAISSSSPYYDPQAAACSASAPCKLVTFSELGAPDVDQRFALWDSWIGKITGGAVQVSSPDLTFHNLVVLSLASGPYANPMPGYTLGWAPDYPDPTDYVGPLLGKDATYTASDTVWEQLTNVSQGFDSLNTAICKAGVASEGWYSNASNPVINTCQGEAYKAMLDLLAKGAITPAGPQRVLLYNMAENIANKLALYVYWGQANEVYSYAAWIDGTTLNSNVTIGGGGDILWFNIGGNNVW